MPSPRNALALIVVAWGWQWRWIGDSGGAVWNEKVRLFRGRPAIQGFVGEEVHFEKRRVVWQGAVSGWTGSKLSYELSEVCSGSEQRCQSRRSCGSQDRRRWMHERFSLILVKVWSFDDGVNMRSKERWRANDGAKAVCQGGGLSLLVSEWNHIYSKSICQNKWVTQSGVVYNLFCLSLCVFDLAVFCIWPPTSLVCLVESPITLKDICTCGKAQRGPEQALNPRLPGYKSSALTIWSKANPLGPVAGVHNQ